MSARAVGDYEIQCETLSASAAEAIEEEGGCAETLRAEAKNLPPALLENTLMPIAALRVQGKRGIALYHGDDGQDHAMRMELEDGEWKVAATLTETLPTN